jgi:type I restriction enzyme R subunit
VYTLIQGIFHAARALNDNIKKGATVKGKATFVCSTHKIANQLIKNILELQPEWDEIRAAAEGTI